MKKELTALLLTATLTLSATACNIGEANGDHHTTPTPSTESTTPTTETTTELTESTLPQVAVTEEQAVEIARGFWNRFFEDTESEYIVVPVANNRWDQSVHVITLKCLVYLDGEPSHYSTVEEICVDRVTGEIRYPNANSESNGPDYIYYVPPITETGDFASYEGIIQLYRNAVHDCARPNYGNEKESALAKNLGITDAKEMEWEFKPEYKGIIPRCSAPQAHLRLRYQGPQQ